MAMMEKNIFLDILAGTIPANIVYQNDHVCAFTDVNPQAPTHILIIPRDEIRTHDDLTDQHAPLIAHLHLAAVAIAKQQNLDSYRLIINCQEGAGQTVPHLHMHLLAGRPLSWPPG